MALPAIIAGISAIAGIASAGAGLLGGPSDSDLDRQRAVNKRISKESQKLEKLRELQMNLEATRMIRQQVRTAAVARATALTAATNQGAGQSSGLQGGLSQISAELGSNISGILQSQNIGQRMFKINRTLTRFGTEANQLQSSIAGDQAMSNTLINVGTSLLGNASTIGNVGASLFGGGPPA